MADCTDEICQDYAVAKKDFPRGNRKLKSYQLIKIPRTHADQISKQSTQRKMQMLSTISHYTSFNIKKEKALVMLGQMKRRFHCTCLAV